MLTPARSTSPSSVLGWGAFLGVSWTWCIGMFLPILLWRDFGPWSFVVFAVPNILGAAAMGFVLRDGASERLVALHGPACRAFSAVTIAFNAFLLIWLFRAGGAGGAGGGWGVALAALTLSIPLLATNGAQRWSAFCLWLVSIGCLAWAYSRGMLRAPVGPDVPPPMLSGADLLMLAPVCVLGFLLCPYLDLTFHRARRALPAAQARSAFAFGFVGFFALMILATPAYAWVFLEHPLLFDGATLASAAFLPLAIHLLGQLGFTVAAHAVELPDQTAAGPSDSPAPRPAWDAPLGWFAVALVLLAVGLAFARFGPSVGGLEPFEVAYRSFMAFYGLVFPAYVWLCVIPPAGRAMALPGRGLLGLWLATIALASPAFALGFLWRESWWLLPGVGVVLVARVLVAGRWPADAPAPPR